MASEKYPMLKTEFYGARGGAKDGRAESILIADYGVNHHDETKTT